MSEAAFRATRRQKFLTEKYFGLNDSDSSRPCDPLLDAIYTAQTPEEKSAFAKQYLDGWCAAFEGEPWHNGHLVVTDEYSNCEGCWAFDAAAVCLRLGIDDASFRDHWLYPKDLADWARSHRSVEQLRGNVADGAMHSVDGDHGQTIMQRVND